jgi:hypothetical protein
MAIVNIIVENDADFYRAFQYVVSDTGAPIDITGGSMEMMLRRHAEDTEALLRLATDSGEIVITNAVQGQFTVKITQDVLERLGLGSFDHSNIMTLNALKIKVWSGTLINNAGPTR